MMAAEYVLRPVGRVESSLTDAESAPMQADEGAPGAWLAFDAALAQALHGLQVGQEVLLLTWLDRADRDVLQTHPRSDAARPLTGVFNTRSPDRPNPIGVHRVRIAAMDGTRVQVEHLEALDGTPILDIKPLLGGVAER